MEEIQQDIVDSKETCAGAVPVFFTVVYWVETYLSSFGALVSDFGIVRQPVHYLIELFLQHVLYLVTFLVFPCVVSQSDEIAPYQEFPVVIVPPFLLPRLRHSFFPFALSCFCSSNIVGDCCGEFCFKRRECICQRYIISIASDGSIIIVSRRWISHE